jgi:hypothetical protein
MAPYEMDEYYDDDEFDYEDDIDNAAEDCGQSYSDDSSCALAGTEHCDFFCPFRDVVLYPKDDSESDLDDDGVYEGDVVIHHPDDLDDIPW